MMNDRRTLELTQKMEQMLVENKSMGHRLNEHHRNIEDIYMQLNWDEHIIDLQNEINDLRIEYEFFTHSIQYIVTDLKETAQRQVQSIKEIEFQLIKHEENYTQWHEELKKLSQSLSRKEIAIYTNMNSKFADSQIENQTEFNVLRSNIEASPRSILDTNEAIVKRLEQIETDYSNALKKVNFLDYCVHKLEDEIKKLHKI